MHIGGHYFWLRDAIPNVQILANNLLACWSPYDRYDILTEEVIDNKPCDIMPCGHLFINVVMKICMAAISRRAYFRVEYHSWRCLLLIYTSADNRTIDNLDNYANCRNRMNVLRLTLLQRLNLAINKATLSIMEWKIAFRIAARQFVR